MVKHFALSFGSPEETAGPANRPAGAVESKYDDSDDEEVKGPGVAASDAVGTESLPRTSGDDD